MDLSPLQQRALAAVHAWLADPRAPQVFRLFGYAGSGKSTLAKMIADIVDGRVRYAAYTGKAALVMQQKGCEGAQTIHSMIYRSGGDPPTLEQLTQRLAAAQQAASKAAAGSAFRDACDAQVCRLEQDVADARDPRKKRGPRFTLNEASDVRDAKLIIVDEVSMVSRDLGDDLCSFGVKILALGDPAQLPPVYGGGYFTAQAPDFLLDEVHRQASDSPILWAATQVRLGRELPYGDHGANLLVTRNGDERNATRAMAADMILCGRNSTRIATNAHVRKLLGRSGWPCEGDAMVCLRNDREMGLLNGSLWTVSSCHPDEEAMEMDIALRDGETRLECRAWMHHVAGRGAELDKLFGGRRELQELTWAYALTVHKAQGSQFDSVFVKDESSSFGHAARAWLYTALTRAVSTLTVVR